MAAPVFQSKHVHTNTLIEANLSRYFGLDPRASAEQASPALRDIHVRLVKLVSDPYHKLPVASAAIELAMSQTNNNQRKKFARAGARLAKEVIAAVPLSKANHTRRESVHAQRLRNLSGLLISNTAHNRASYATTLTTQLDDILAEFHDPTIGDGAINQVTGHAVKQTVLCLGAGPQAQERGLFAYASMERQQRATSLVDDFKYRWDLIIESSGIVAPAGQYRVRAFSGGELTPPTNVVEYHPDIAVVSGTADLGDNPYMGQRLVAAQDIVAGNEPAIERHLDVVVHKLLNAGPASPDRLLLAS